MQNDILDFLCPSRFGSTSNLLNWVREKSTSALETGKENSHSKFCHVDIIYFAFIIPVNTIFNTDLPVVLFYYLGYARYQTPLLHSSVTPFNFFYCRSWNMYALVFGNPSLVFSAFWPSLVVDLCGPWLSFESSNTSAYRSHGLKNHWICLNSFIIYLLLPDPSPFVSR